MTANLTVVRVERFPCEPWRVDGEKDERILPVPGTWTLAPETVWAQGIKGILCCPARECKQAALVRYDMGTVENGVLILDKFQCAKCQLVLDVRLLNWDTRKLFCVAYEILHKDGTRTLRKEYLHAEGRHEAIAALATGTGYILDQNGLEWQLVDAAVAIGFFGHESDKDQLKLSVD